MKRLFAFLVMIALAAPAWADYEAAAEYSAGLRGISMIVIEDGEMVFEAYAENHGADEAHPIASGTKSFAGILAAAAIDDGYLSLDEKVSDTITEWQGTLRENLTVRQLLTLTAGLPPTRGGRVPPYRRAIQVDIATTPDTSFIYSPVPFQVFGELMKRKLDRDPLVYLSERVLDPIGLEVANWRRDRNDDPMMAAGARLTARDWARLGEFLLARGEWDGETIISWETLEQFFTGTAVNPAYGITWWLNDPINPRRAAATPPLDRETDFWQYPEELPGDLVMAAGAGNQRLYVSWDRNLVVVRQAEGIMGALLGRRLSWSDVQFWRLMDAEPGETPAQLPPIEFESSEREQGPGPAQPAGGGDQPGFTLPSGPGGSGYNFPSAAGTAPTTADSDDEGVDEVDGDEAEDEDDFVGPTF